MKIYLEDVENLEVDGVDVKDAPEFCDAYFSSATFKKTGKELNDFQLEYLTDNYPELLSEMAYESLI